MLLYAKQKRPRSLDGKRSLLLTYTAHFLMGDLVMSKNNTTKKAVVASVNYAGFEFPGLQLPDGSYAIAVSQVVELFQRNNEGFQFLKNNAQRDIKYLLGKDFQFLKSASEIHPKKVNILTIEQFGELTFHVAFRGNDVAKAILKASVSTTIEQAFDIAFDNKRSLEEYQEKQKARVQGKATRRTMTNVVRDYVKARSEELSDNYKQYIYNNCSDRTYRLIFGRSAKQLKEDWKCIDVRAEMTAEELMIVGSIERLAMALIEEQGIEPQAAISEAGKRLMIKKIER